MLYLILTLILAYLIGSIPFAIITAWIFHLDDPRNYGSGNPGATNVLRSGHRVAAVLTLLGDCVKGWLIVWVTQRFLGFDASHAALAGVAVLLGHVFSVFLRFKGGKSVATAGGVLLGIEPFVGLSCLAVWGLTLFISRISSLAALIAAITAPIASIIFTNEDRLTFVGISALITLIIFARHRSNIARLLNGSEGKLGCGKK